MEPPVDDTVRVSPQEMRNLFNSSGYYQRVLAGEFTTKLVRDKVPLRLPPSEPAETKSQNVYYYDENGVFVALVHQYLRPDGTIGASGRPDPKKLYLNGHMYKLIPENR